MFTGAMDYWPNIDAVCWFARGVLPLVRGQEPAARFYIVGMNPSPAVRELAGESVVVTGRVDDVRPYLRHASVAVAPLRVARGMQNKVLEAMPMAKPVVALVHALRPKEGVDEGMDEFVALLHAAYLYWLQGEPLRRLEIGELAGLLGPEASGLPEAAAPAIRYVQFPPLRIWGAAGEGVAHEPFDGCFVVWRHDRLAVVGILGLIVAAAHWACFVFPVIRSKPTPDDLDGA